MEEYAIRMQGISKVFPTKKGPFVAVKDVSFGVRDKEFVSLVGPSGCGKSTILRMLGGILRPSAGTISYYGELYKDGVPSQARKKIGFVFQSHNLLPWRTVRQNLALPLEVLNLSGDTWYSRIDELLEMVGLRDFADAYPLELSDGMKQRIGVIRALVHDPQILLMDEPFASLDEITREQLDVELLSLWMQTKKTIVFITHNVDEAVLLSSRVFVMATNPGRITQEVDIPLPGPRTLETVGSEAYTELCESVRELIGRGKLGQTMQREDVSG